MKIYQSIFTGLLAVASLACQSQEAQTVRNSAENNTNSITHSMSNSLVNSDVSGNKENVYELVESFSEDTKIGVLGKNKIEIFNFKKAEGNVAQIKFYSLSANNQWKLKQTFEYEKDALIGCNTEISDFNNDGYKDVTYVSNVAARGANEVRRLFIYDKKTDELVPIKNSEDYPNLLYNRYLNCLDAQRFYGGNATDFLKIEGNVLKQFAYVETTGNERKVYSVDKNGRGKLLRTDKVSEDFAFERYKTFNPPTVYSAKDLQQ